jgi:hypothetical protein
MKIMNRNSKIPWKNKYLPKTVCAEYMKSLKCKPCKSTRRILRYMIKKSKKNPKYKASEKYLEKFSKIQLKCINCQTKGTKPCNFENFLKYSGAVKGKCSFTPLNK